MRICIGGLIDLIAAILNSIALNYVTGSVYQMMRGGTIAATFFFSVYSLKLSAKKHQFIGSGLAILGLLIVGVSNYLYKTSEEEDTVCIYLYFIGFIHHWNRASRCGILYQWLSADLLVEIVQEVSHRTFGNVGVIRYFWVGMLYPYHYCCQLHPLSLWS